MSCNECNDLQVFIEELRTCGSLEITEKNEVALLDLREVELLELCETGAPVPVPNNSTFIMGEVPSGNIDGINQVFTTAHDFEQLAVYLNGLRQLNGADYDITDNNEFTFLAYTPQTGDTIQVDYTYPS